MIEKKYEFTNMLINLPISLSTCFPSEELVFLDIETTGFDRLKSQLTVIGLMMFTGSNLTLHQLFCEKRSDEKNVLLRLNELLKGKRALLTFNGNSFDVPYLNAKFQQASVSSMLQKLCSIDLYEVAKIVYSGHKGLKLKDIERYLSIERTDTVSGKEVVDLYYNFLRTKDSEAVKSILLHNYDDVLNMKGLLELLSLIPEAQTRLVTPILIDDPGKSILYRAIINGDFLEVKLMTSKCQSLISQEITQNQFNEPNMKVTPFSELDVDSGQLSLRIPLMPFEAAFVVDTTALFHLPLSHFDQTASYFIIAIDGYLIIENVKFVINYMLNHPKLLIK